MSDATQTGNWIQAGATVLGFMVLWMKLSGKGEKREIGPQPFQVEPAPRYAAEHHNHPEYITRADCREMHLGVRQVEGEKFEAIQRQLDHLGNRMDATLKEHNKDAEVRANAIHSRITDLIPTISAVEARLEDHINTHARKS